MERDYGYAFMERNEERLGILEPADGYLGTTGNNPGFGIKGSSSNFGIRGDNADRRNDDRGRYSPGAEDYGRNVMSDQAKKETERKEEAVYGAVWYG